MVSPGWESRGKTRKEDPLISSRDTLPSQGAGGSPGLNLGQKWPVGSKAMVIIVGMLRRSRKTRAEQCRAVQSSLVSRMTRAGALTHHVHPATRKHLRQPVSSQNLPCKGYSGSNLKRYEVICSTFTLKHFQLGTHLQLMQISEVPVF